MRLFYTTLGPEEGQNVELTFSNFPAGVFSSVVVASGVSLLGNLTKQLK